MDAEIDKIINEEQKNSQSVVEKYLFDTTIHIMAGIRKKA